jgi:hypothetical protein
MTDEENTLNPKEFSRCVQAVADAQLACEHRRKASYTQRMGGKVFTMQQCVDCFRYFPKRATLDDVAKTFRHS